MTPWATVSGFWSDENPARWRGHLDHLLPKPSTVQKTEHHPAISCSQIGQFMAELRAHQGTAALALEFAILTAARTNEAIKAPWEEFALEKKLWTIPAVRMKGKKEHLVPLSEQTLKIIKDLEEIKTGVFVFPGGKANAPLSNTAMSANLKRMDHTDITVHGFWSTFRNWAGDKTTFAQEMIEHALAHQLKDKAEAAYSRSTMPEKRRELIEAWGEYCASSSSKAKS